MRATLSVLLNYTSMVALKAVVCPGSQKVNFFLKIAPKAMVSSQTADVKHILLFKSSSEVTVVNSGIWQEAQYILKSESNGCKLRKLKESKAFFMVALKGTTVNSANWQEVKHFPR